MKRIIRNLSALVLNLALIPCGSAQTWNGFDPVADAPVHCAVLQPDGKVVVGGEFAQVGGAARIRIARLNPDGVADGALSAGANGTVRCLALQADGGIILGGDFTTVGGIERRHLARLRSDGTLDADFNPNADGDVLGVAVQANGDILVGGSFTAIGGVPRNRLARLNPDGVADPAFNPGCDGRVRCLGIQADGAVLAGGDFTHAGGQPHSGLARFRPDGNSDSAFQPTTNGAVSCLAVQGDGRVLIGGTFTVVEGAVRNHLARLHGNGTLDADFAPDANGDVLTLRLQPDGGILAGGGFTRLGATARNRIARLAVDGTIDGTFNPDASDTVRCIMLQDDGRMVVGGDFSMIGSERQGWRLERLNADGTSDVFNSSAGVIIRDLAVQADGLILTNTSKVMNRLNPDGSPDSGWMPNSKSETANCMAALEDGGVLVGGYFKSYHGLPHQRLARLLADGSADPAFLPEIDSPVNSLAIQADGRILIGGSFGQVGGVTHTRIARLNADGSPDPAFTPSVSASVNVIAVQPDGRILIGGEFTTVNGVTRNRIARLLADGTLDAGFNPNANKRVNAFALQPDGRMLVAGAFTTLGGVARKGLARLQADGSLDDSFNAKVEGPNGFVEIQALGLQVNGQVLIGGSFTFLDGVWQANFARVNADGSRDRGFFAVVDRGLTCLALQDNGEILIGGEFTTINGKLHSGVGSLRNPLAAFQDLTMSGGEIRWHRSGSAPELDQVTFQVWSGSRWSGLGAAARVPDGWLLSGASVPEGSWVRALGRVSGGASLVSQRIIHGSGPQPRIAVREAAGDPLLPGYSTVTFGDHDWRATVSRTLVISNEGTAPLTSLSLGISEVGGTWFHLVGPSVTTLAPGVSATFEVGFSPYGSGQRTAVLTIVSNDGGGSPFSFGLAGTGIHQDPDFNPNASAPVICLAVQPDRKILMGGNFTSVGGVARYRLARVNPDGSPDTAFNPNVIGYVQCLLVQPDAKILAGGPSQQVGGVTRNRLVRLNPDGTPDPGFTVDADADVLCLVLQSDGKLLVGGLFTKINGVARKYLARLETDGTLDMSFNPNPDRSVLCAALQSDGRIVIGGTFTMVAGATRYNLARLNADGSADPGFNPQPNATVIDLWPLRDGRIYVAGSFTAVGGQSRSRIVRLLPDGTVDSSFAATPDNSVTTLAVQSDGRILIGGSFDTVGGSPGHRLARLHEDGLPDTTFNTACSSVSALVLEKDGGILVGGSFSTIGGAARNNLARLPNNTTGVSSLAITAPDELTWTIGGGTPEFQQVVCESWNGAGWDHLAAATRVAEGWRATGLALAEAGWVRARGMAGDGKGASLYEQDASYGAGELPDLMLTDAATGDPVPGNAVVDFGTQDHGTTAPQRSFLLTNIGTAPLTGLAAGLVGPNPADFILEGPATAVLEPGSSTTVSVRFAPEGVNARSAVLSITANDPDTPIRTITLAGYGRQLELGFDPVLDGVISSVTLQPDGKTVIAGSFATVDGVARCRLARLNPDGSLDAGFKSRVEGGFGTVFSLGLQADGRILLGGDFIDVGGLVRNSLARLNADGSVDPTFDPNSNGRVYCVAEQPDGRILVGGSFTMIGGTTRNRIARLNADGSLDPSFDPNAGGTIGCILPLASGKILVGGLFSLISGAARSGLVRLNADGSLDTGFNAGAVNEVYLLATRPDGSIVIGGDFTTVGGVARNRLARLNADGALDAGFNPGSNNSVSCLALQTDGRLLVGGYFSNIGGLYRCYLARLNPDGSADSSFDPVPNGNVTALGLQPDGRIIAGGSFSHIGGGKCSKLARLSNNTEASGELEITTDSLEWRRGGSAPEIERVRVETWNGGGWDDRGAAVRMPGGWSLGGLALAPGTWLRVRGRTAADGTDGSIVEQSALHGSGPFPELRVRDAAGNVLTAGTAAVDFGTRDWLSPSAPLTFTLSNTGEAPLTGISVGVGGANAADFTPVGSVPATLAPGGSATFTVSFTAHGGGNRAAALAIRSNDPTAQPFDLALTGAGLHQDLGFNCNANGTVTEVAIEADGRVLIGGSFTTVNGIARNRLARLNPDGSLDPTFDPNLNGTLACIAVLADGRIIIGGMFGKVGGVTRNRLARLNPDGSLDPQFDPNANDTISAMAPQADGKLLIGGWFTSLGAATFKYLARLNPDGSVDTGFNPNPSGAVRSVALQTDGSIVLGGDFTTIGGVARNRLARVNAAGKLDGGFDPNANDLVHCIAIQADGRIVIGGMFSTVGGLPRKWLARLNGDGTIDSGFAPGADASPYCLVSQADGCLLVTGSFINLGGEVRNRIARLLPTGVLDPAFDPNADNFISGLALQPDGGIIVVGNFSTIGGLGRTRVARLPNNMAAVSSLTAAADRIEWLRAGSAPEFDRVEFENWDGTAWLDHGAADRVAGGWSLTGISIPATSWVRARGWCSAGGGNDCSFSEFRMVSYGPGGLPDIAVRLESGSGWLPQQASVDFGSTAAGSGEVIRSFAITNTGNAPLSGLAVTFEGIHAADFLAEGPATTVLAPGDSAAMIVRFRPLGGGIRTAAISIGSNDGDESPFVLALTGNGVCRDRGTSPVFNGTVTAIATQADGRILVAGGFTTVNGEGRRFLVRLHPDGTVDNGFYQSVVSADIDCVAVQRDGGIVIGGQFSTVGGVRRYRIARLHPDGTLDMGFDPNANDHVKCLALQADGGILAGGYFTAIGGQARNRIARLNPDGTVDPAFDPNAGHYVECLAVQPDGRILLGGWFATISGVARNRLARLNADGTLDNLPNLNLDGAVFSIATQADAGIVIGGAFTSVGGLARNRIARLNHDGSPDALFDPGADNPLYSIVVQADGGILIGGSFTEVAGASRSRIARLHAGGGLDASFDPSAEGDVGAIALAADGGVLIGGGSGAVGGVARSGFAALSNNIAGVSHLAVTGPGQVDWQRGGSVPELGQVVLQKMQDGKWLDLGPAEQVPGGWRATGLDLTDCAWLRALGYGGDGGSVSLSGLVEWCGTGGSPDLAVENADGVELTAANTPDEFGACALGASLKRRFTVRNRGDADLTEIALSPESSAAAGFAVGALSATSLAPGETAAFEVVFSPIMLGKVTASILVSSNDPAESPFPLGLSGTGIGAPDIALELADGTLPPSGSSIQFGSIPPGGAITKALTIRNLGNGHLSLGEAIAIGGDSGDFIVSGGLPTGLAPGARAPLSAVFRPSATGVRGSTLEISNSDADESSFVLDVAGIGESPPVLVALPGGGLGIFFQGIPSGIYQIERSTALESWTFLGAVVADAGGRVEFTDPAPPPDRAFYRLRKP